MEWAKIKPQQNLENSLEFMYSNPTPVQGLGPRQPLHEHIQSIDPKKYVCYNRSQSFDPPLG